MIGIDYIGRCKSNYHMTTAADSKIPQLLVSIFHIVMLITDFQILRKIAIYDFHTMNIWFHHDHMT